MCDFSCNQRTSGDSESECSQTCEGYVTEVTQAAIYGAGLTAAGFLLLFIFTGGAALPLMILHAAGGGAVMATLALAVVAGAVANDFDCPAYCSTFSECQCPQGSYLSTDQGCVSCGPGLWTMSSDLLGKTAVNTWMDLPPTSSSFPFESSVSAADCYICPQGHFCNLTKVSGTQGHSAALSLLENAMLSRKFPSGMKPVKRECGINPDDDDTQRDTFYCPPGSAEPKRVTSKSFCTVGPMRQRHSYTTCGNLETSIDGTLGAKSVTVTGQYPEKVRYSKLTLKNTGNTPVGFQVKEDSLQGKWLILEDEDGGSTKTGIIPPQGINVFVMTLFTTLAEEKPDNIGSFGITWWPAMTPEFGGSRGPEKDSKTVDIDVTFEMRKVKLVHVPLDGPTVRIRSGSTTNAHFDLLNTGKNNIKWENAGIVGPDDLLHPWTTSTKKLLPATRPSPNSAINVATFTGALTGTIMAAADREQDIAFGVDATDLKAGIYETRVKIRLPTLGGSQALMVPLVVNVSPGITNAKLSTVSLKADEDVYILGGGSPAKGVHAGSAFEISIKTRDRFGDLNDEDTGVFALSWTGGNVTETRTLRTTVVAENGPSASGSKGSSSGGGGGGCSSETGKYVHAHREAKGFPRPGNYSILLSYKQAPEAANTTVWAAPITISVVDRLCDPGSEPTADSSRCRCKPGYEEISVNREIVCLRCGAGKVSFSNGDPCETCPSGLFKANLGDVTCTLCPTGKISAGVEGCTRCVPGKYSTSKRDKCESCEAGWFGESFGLSDSACSGKCQPGFYSEKGWQICKPCAEDSYSPGEGEAYCKTCTKQNQISFMGSSACHCKNTYWLDPKGDCVKCPDGIDCFGATASEVAATSANGTVNGSAAVVGGVTVATATIKPSFWRSSPNSMVVLECPVALACRGFDIKTALVVAGGGGGITTRINMVAAAIYSNGSGSSAGIAPSFRNASALDYLCEPGNTGPLCMVCSKGYFRSGRGKPCDTLCSADPTGAVFWVIGGGFLIVAMFVIFLLVNRRASSGLLRPVINFVQYMSIMLLFDIPFPALLKKLSRVLAALNFEVFETVSVQCIDVNTNYYSQFTLTIGLLTMAIVAIWTPMIAARLRRKDATARVATLNQAVRDTVI